MTRTDGPSEADPDPATGPIRVRRRPRPGRVLLGVLVVAVVALALIPDRLGLDGTLPFVAFVLVRAPATILVVVLALLALAVRARWWPTVVPVLVIAAVSVAALLPRVIPDGPGPDAGPDLVVMTFNVDRGSADVEALSRLLHLRRPDVVVLPEAGEPYRARLAPLVADLGYRSWSSTSPPRPTSRARRSSPARPSARSAPTSSATSASRGYSSPGAPSAGRGWSGRTWPRRSRRWSTPGRPSSRPCSAGAGPRPGRPPSSAT